MTAGEAFGHRGFTLQGIPHEEDGRVLIEWMARRGLNRLEVNTIHRMFSTVVREFPDLSVADAEERTAVLRSLVDYGRAEGVRVVPALSHPDTLHVISRLRPGWMAKGSIPHASGTDLATFALCFSQPDVVRLYHAVIGEMVRAVEPDEVQFWLTENRLRCECGDCQGAAGEGAGVHELTEFYFREQARIFYSSVEEARRSRPGLEVSMWTSQGSRAHNAVLIPSLPRDVLWFYYDGERRGCYNLRRRRVVPPEIAALRQQGFRIGIQLDWASCADFLTTPGTIRELCAEASEAGLEAVCGWIGEDELAAPEALHRHPVLAYAGEMLRGPAGDDLTSLERVMTGVTLEAGLPGPVARAAGRAWRVLDEHARTILLSDCYSFWWQGVNVPGAICERIIRRACADEIDQRWADEAWDTTIPALDRAVEELESEAGRLDELSDGSGHAGWLSGRLRTAALWGRMSRHVYWAGVVFNRLGSWDTGGGPWRDPHAEIVHALDHALRCLDKAVALAGSENRQDEYRIMRWRSATLRQQLVEARAAAGEGAAPTPLPRRDPYPYSPAPRPEKKKLRRTGRWRANV